MVVYTVKWQQYGCLYSKETKIFSTPTNRECGTNNPCDQLCTDTPGSYTCACRAGFTMDANQKCQGKHSLYFALKYIYALMIMPPLWKFCPLTLYSIIVASLWL
jgi:hypothetical protein